MNQPLSNQSRCVCVRIRRTTEEREKGKGVNEGVGPHVGLGDLLLEAGPVVHLVCRWFLKRKAEGVHVRVPLPRGVGETIFDDRTEVARFFKVVTEEPELHIRHNKPIQR